MRSENEPFSPAGAENDTMRAVRVNQNSEVVDLTAAQWDETCYNTAVDSDNNSLWVNHYKHIDTLFSRCHLMWFDTLYQF